MKKEIKRIIRTSNKTIFMFFIGVMLLILVFFPSHANASNRTIKVGWQISKGFQELDDFGNCTGYNFEYLSKISQYTGWNYEFVHGDLSELLSKIEKGEIDLLGGVAFTEERTEKFVYNSYSTFSSFLVLLAKVDNSELNFGHFSALNNKKVGILDTGVRDEAFDSLAKNNNFSSNLIVTTSDSEALEKVKSGELDATLVNMNAMTPDFKVIAMLSPRDFYFVVPKGKEQIALELDKAISYIKILEPDFEDSVFSKYFSIGESQNFLFFDNEEKKFIDENPSINAYSVEDLEPLMYRSQKNGDLSGFLYDYTNLAIGKTGLNLTYYTEKNLSSLIEKYDSDPKGILVFAPLDFDWAEKHNSFITQSFFSLPSVFLLTRKHSGDVKKVGILVNNLITVNKPTNDKYDFRKFDSTKDALLALRKGEIDAIQMDSYSAERLLGFFANKDLKFIVVDGAQEIAIAIHKDAPFELYSILAKALASVSEDDRNYLLIEDTANISPSSWREFFYENSTLSIILIIILTCFIIFILFLIFKNLSSRRINNKIQKVNDELKKAKLKAEKASYEAYKANQAKSIFLSKMSHEIRTPLNAIVGFHELMRANLGDKKILTNYLQQADNSSQILLGTINDILDVSAIESNKMQLANLDFDLKDLICEITLMYHELCKQKDITFYARGYNIFEEYLVGDSFRLRQILINLLSNALKFTPKGGRIEFNILQTAHTRTSVHMRFIVKDNGCGMGEKIQKSLFKEFVQEDSTIVRTHGGSGLGLSIVKSLVDMFKGSIQVESEKGKGSQFSVGMTLLTSKEKKPDLRQISNYKALIVDDDVETCKYVSTLCKSLGIENEYINYPLEALEIAKKAKANGKPFNLYIVDEKMPDLNGIELGKKLRIEMGKEPVLMILTGYDVNLIRKSCEKIDVNFVLSKPIFRSQLYSLLDFTEKSVFEKRNDSIEFDFTGRKILLAEDNELNILVATKLLEKVGLKITVARNGKQAFEEFLASRDDEFDLILMDIQMPIMDGYQATFNIRNSGVPCAKTIPIFAMTANAFSDDVKKSLDSGMNGHLSKPINVSTLYKTIRECCQKKDKRL